MQFADCGSVLEGEALENENKKNMTNIYMIVTFVIKSRAENVVILMRAGTKVIGEDIVYLIRIGSKDN